MKKLLTIAAGLVAMGAASTASAVDLNFGTHSIGNEHGISSGSFEVVNGVNLQFFSSHNAYFDGPSGGKLGGLGVCKVLTATDQCDPGSDDNVSEREEWVAIVFADGPRDVLSLAFRDANHNDLTSGDTGLTVLLYNADLSLRQTITQSFAWFIANAGSAVFQNLGAIRFDYLNDNRGQQFYVDILGINDIPIPGALPLLLSGIAGLGFASRRKKKAA